MDAHLLTLYKQIYRLYNINSVCLCVHPLFIRSALFPILSIKISYIFIFPFYLFYAKKYTCSV